MAWIDEMIGWVSPEWGARRLAFRNVMASQRGYDAARRDPRTMSWRTSGASANAEIVGSEELVRNRARDLIRNNGFALQIVDTFADNVVGAGIVGAPTGLRTRNAQKVSGAWNDWGEVCDFDGDHDINGLMWLAAKGMAESGAALIRFRRQPFDASTTIAPLQLQVLEPDFIDPLRVGTTPQGGIIDRGIEYDAAGRKVAFWLYDHHPGDVAQFRARTLISTRVPIEELIYLYDKLRPGQDRGMPLLAPAVMKLRDLDGYFQAELVRKRIESCLAAFITSDEQDGVPIGTAATPGQPGIGHNGAPRIEKFEPGMITRLKPGEQVTVTQPANSQGVSEFAQISLREISAAAGVMYEHTTGDFSQVNYSSFRAGNHAFRRRMERRQWHVMIHKACRPIAARFTEAARAAQLLPNADFGWRWTPPGFISVDPYKDAQADLANLRMGKVTPSQLVEANGYDYLEFLTTLAQDLGAADAALSPLNGGKPVMFDGDPRKTLGAGTPNAEKSGKAAVEATEA